MTKHKTWCRCRLADGAVASRSASPGEVARACGLVDGEAVDIHAEGGAIIIHPSTAEADARVRAERTGAAMLADSQNYAIGGVTIRELRDEGRRG